MKSPLTIYNEVAEAFNVTTDKQLHIRQKTAYIESQIQEKQAIINRLLIDIAITTIQLEKMQDNATKSAYSGKIRGYEDDLRQLSDALDIDIQLKAEFDKEMTTSGEER